jgi:hypothetical protein
MSGLTQIMWFIVTFRGRGRKLATTILPYCSSMLRPESTPQKVTMNHIVEHETGALSVSVFMLTYGSGDHELLHNAARATPSVLLSRHIGPSDVAFSQLHSAKPGTVQELGNRAMQAYNERWRIGMPRSGMHALRESDRQC